MWVSSSEVDVGVVRDDACVTTASALLAELINETYGIVLRQMLFSWNSV